MTTDQITKALEGTGHDDKDPLWRILYIVNLNKKLRAAVEQTEALPTTPKQWQAILQKATIYGKPLKHFLPANQIAELAKSLHLLTSKPNETRNG